MKRHLSSLVLLLSVVSSSGAQIEAHFSPNGDCTKVIVEEISRAKKSVLIQAYSFTSAPIARAVVEAHKRKVSVYIILDKSQRTDKYSALTFFKNNGVPTVIDAKHTIAHNKVMVIDGEEVITGSFNFTKAAEESNAENLVVIRDSKVAKQYAENWSEHRKHSE